VTRPLPETPDHEWAKIIATLLFAIGLLFFGYMSVSGYAWIILPLPIFSFWLTLLAFVLAVVAGTVGTYSLVSFTQTREIRSLMLFLMGIDIIIWSFLFLATHPSSAEWSILFASRDRNRTLGMGLVLIIVPPILIGSFSGEARSSRFSSVLLIIWAMIITPIISLWFFFSPEPVFLMTSPEGGLEGLTPTGMIISLGYLFSQIVAILRFTQRWWKTRDTLDLTLLLALTHWITGTFFIIILWDPFQIAELLWLGTIITGYLLIAAVLFVTTIIDPHRALETLVEERTSELELSNKESEYYLNMWTHKMGNILQGMVTYLDVLEVATQDSTDDRQTRSAARDLSREAILVNQQVLQLTQIKESFHQDLQAVNVRSALEHAISKATEILGDDAFKIQFVVDESVFVKGDDLLELVFLNIITYTVKNKVDEKISLDISLRESDSSIEVFVRSRGKALPREVEDFLIGDSLIGSTSLDLNIFTIKLLIDRYRGRILCLRDDSSLETTCAFEFQKP